MSSDLSKKIEMFKLQAVEQHEKIVKASLLDLFSSIVLGTPVLSGVLRNGWYMSFDVPSDKVPTRGAPTGGATIDRIKGEMKFYNTISDIYFVNNVHYGPYIEYDGISQKAPEGMMRINAMRWDEIVKNNVVKYGSRL